MAGIGRGMNGLRPALRCATVTLVLVAVLAPGTAAAEDVAYTHFSNKYAFGFVRLNHIDSKMSTTASISNKWIDKDFVSVTNVKLQRHGCESGWKTKDSRPSQDGFHKGHELDYTRDNVRRGGRGLWRGSAVLKYKDTRGGPVVWKKKIFTQTWGNCHPVPPTP
jgi:hypothetical protein